MCLFMDKTGEFMKNIEVKKGLLIAAILIFLACIGFEFCAYKSMKNTTQNAKPLLEVTDSNEYAYIDVETMTECFAKYTEGENTLEEVHFVFDVDYLYIASINSKYQKELKDILDYTYSTDETLIKPETVRIYGYSTYIPDELESLAIESYNDIFYTDFMESANFHDYFGYYYLNTEKSPAEDFLWQSILIGVLAVVGLVCLYVYNKKMKTTKMTMSSYTHQMEKIKMDINAPETVYSKKAKIYLTEYYIINFANGFEIYEYKDIVWIYPHELRQNGFVTQKSIYIVTKDSKVHAIANMGASKKNATTYNELYETLRIRIPHALYGYTKKNIAKSKEMYDTKKG